MKHDGCNVTGKNMLPSSIENDLMVHENVSFTPYQLVKVHLEPNFMMCIVFYYRTSWNYAERVHCSRW